MVVVRREVKRSLSCRNYIRPAEGRIELAKRRVLAMLLASAGGDSMTVLHLKLLPAHRAVVSRSSQSSDKLGASWAF